MKALAAAAAAALLAAGLPGCELLKKNEETTAVINRRVIGMAVGDFFDRYGKPRRRTETNDGASYGWESAVGFTPAGITGQEERICRLVLTADRRGRISAVEVQFDAPGRTGTSRCREIFEGG